MLDLKKRRLLRISVLGILDKYHLRTSLANVGDRSDLRYIRRWRQK